MQVSFRPSLTGGFVLNRWPFDVEKMMTNYDKLLELIGAIDFGHVGSSQLASESWPKGQPFRELEVSFTPSPWRKLSCVVSQQLDPT